MSPRVAVIMRTKDRPLLLARGLRSALSQTYDDFLVVVVNDGGDLDVVRECVATAGDRARDRVTVVDNTHPAGREAAMNVGIEAIGSEFVVVHDDDDSWAPTFLERTVAHLDAHPDHGGVNVRTAVVRERVMGDRIVEEGREILASDQHDVTLVEMLQRNYVTTIGFLYRRGVYDEIGPVDGSLPVLGDWEFLLRFLRRHKIGFIDGEPLAFWHQRPHSRGSEGNSVVVAADEHRDYAGRIRDDYLRRSLDEGDRFGDFLLLGGMFDDLQRRSDESRAAAAAQLEGLRLMLAEVLENQRAILARQDEADAAIRDIRTVTHAVKPFLTGAHELGKPLFALRRRLGRGGRPAPAQQPADAEPSAAPAPAGGGATAGEGAPAASGIAPRFQEPPVPAVRRDRIDTRTPGRAMRRVAFYVVYDPHGQVDDYVVYMLEKLRDHVEHIVVVSNGQLALDSRARLERAADEVWERDNTGFDITAHKEAHERFGWDRLAEYDELLMLNDTFFGPIFPFSELFDRMDESDVDFWGVTEHEAVTPHPRDETRTMPAHIQSHWIAVRRAMLVSPEYREYWETMPELDSYESAIDVHEAVFTQHFANLGFTYEVAFPAADYPSRHPIFDNIVLMLEDRVPIMKRRMFFHDPLYLDREVILVRDAMKLVDASDYPSELIWANVVRRAQPRVLATNVSMTEILPEADTGLDRARIPSIAVIAHLYYDDLGDELMSHVETLPGEPHIVITTTDEKKRASLQAMLERRGLAHRAEVRIVESNRGRDISAFLVGCADVLRDERYDLVVKIHGKKSVQDGWNAATWFKRHLLENLMHSPGYSANVVKLFQDDPLLGMVFPPIIHMGYPTMGHAWFLNKEPAQQLAAELGITVPFDDTTPLAPFGSMFIARREALRPLVEAGFTWDDFPNEGGYKDGGLAHVLERLLGYAVLEEGFTLRTVMNAELAAISHTFLEYKLQAVSAFLPAFAVDQVPRLRELTGR